MTQAFDYDVVIAGGGMVGASLALLLQQHARGSVKVLVVESFNAASSTSELIYSPSFDARSTALSYGSRMIFQHLGLWSELSQHVSEIKHIHVSERGAFASATMHADEMQWPALGYVVENTWLGRVLLSALSNSLVEFSCPASVEKAQPMQAGIRIRLQEAGQHRDISAQLLVVADGAQSQLRQQLGIQHHTQPYYQSAIVANVAFAQTHQQTAFERFTDQGPMALLPLLEPNRSALVWTMPPVQAQSLCVADQSEFLNYLQQRFGHRLGQFTLVGERVHYPLQLVESDEQIRSHVVVMGNAAHALHPVAGQGFNLALRDCARLTECIIAAEQQHQNLGELSVLQAYQRAQRLDQQKTTWFSDKVGAVFAHSSRSLSVLRNLGLLALDILPLLKENFVRHAAGQHAGAALGFTPPTAEKKIELNYE